MKKLLIIALFATGCTTIGVKRECEYKLPEGYVLAYERSANEYAINTGQGWFLQDFVFHISSVGRAGDAQLFNDSCKAKGYCHKYIRQMYGDFIDVKELK